MIKAAVVQFNHHAGDKAYNLGRIAHFVQEASDEGVQLLAFPEMCITGYWHVRTLSREGIVALAEPVPDGPSTQAISQLAQEQEMLIGAGLIEVAEDGELFNTYVLCDKDGAVHKHRKIHCFISAHMESGDSYTVFDTRN